MLKAYVRKPENARKASESGKSDVLASGLRTSEDDVGEDLEDYDEFPDALTSTTS